MLSRTYSTAEHADIQGAVREAVERAVAPTPPAPLGLVDAVRRYQRAVRSLGENSGYNGLTFFEAPISKMPNDDLGMEAVRRWRELNDAGRALTTVLSAIPGVQHG